MTPIQQPGRIEALRIVLSGHPAPPVMLHIAGLDSLTRRRAPDAPHGALTFASGIEQLSRAEREALPF